AFWASAWSNTFSLESNAQLDGGIGPYATTPMLKLMSFKTAYRSTAIATAFRLAGSLNGGAPVLSSKPLKPIAAVSRQMRLESDLPPGTSFAQLVPAMW